MTASCFQAMLLVSVSLILSSTHGSGRKMMMETYGYQDAASPVSLEENAREMIQLDYVDAGPNCNSRGGYPFTPPPPPLPPPSPSPSPEN